MERLKEPTRRGVDVGGSEVTRWVEKKRRVNLCFDGMAGRKNNSTAAKPVRALACMTGLGIVEPWTIIRCKRFRTQLQPRPAGTCCRRWLLVVMP